MHGHKLIRGRSYQPRPRANAPPSFGGRFSRKELRPPGAVIGLANGTKVEGGKNGINIFKFES